MSGYKYNQIEYNVNKFLGNQTAQYIVTDSWNDNVEKYRLIQQTFYIQVV